jgi:hypothetical protein
MISTIRKHFSQQGFKAVIWATIVSLAIGSIVFVVDMYRRSSRLSGSAIAYVNGYEITGRELRGRIPLVGGYQAQPEAVKEQALKSLIQEKLLLETADKLGIVLAPTYIEQQLKKPLTFSAEGAHMLMTINDFVPLSSLRSMGILTDKSIDYKKLLKGLQRAGITGSCLENALEERLKGALAKTLIGGAAYVPKEQLQEEFDRLYRGKQFSVATVPLAPYLAQAKQTPPTDAELQKFFQEANEHKQYWSPERRTGKIWTFPESIVDDAFKESAQKAATSSEEEFTAFVKQHGGVERAVGPIERGSGQEEILFLLRPGQRIFLPPSFLELTEVEPATEQSFEKVKEQVAHDYYQQEATKHLTEDLGQLKNITDPSARSTWIKEHQATEGVTGFVSSDKQDTSDKVWQELKQALDPWQLNQLLTTYPVGSKKALMGKDTVGFLIELTALAPFDAQQFDGKRKELFQRQMTREQEQVVNGFLASLEKTAVIRRV